MQILPKTDSRDCRAGRRKEGIVRTQPYTCTGAAGQKWGRSPQRRSSLCLLVTQYRTHTSCKFPAAALLTFIPSRAGGLPRCWAAPCLEKQTVRGPAQPQVPPRKPVKVGCWVLGRRAPACGRRAGVSTAGRDRELSPARPGPVTWTSTRGSQ